MADDEGKVIERVGTFRELVAIIPPEPARGSVVLDGEGAAWQRGTLRWAGVPAVDAWMRSGVILPLFRVGALPEGVAKWSELVTGPGPIILIFRGPEPEGDES
jgi:hypothetical protein